MKKNLQSKFDVKIPDVAMRKREIPNLCNGLYCSFLLFDSDRWKYIETFPGTKG